MIPVDRQPEPPEFEARVRAPGRQWLRDRGISPQEAPPDPSALPPYWRRTQKALWEAYNGVCAYLCIYFEWPSGAQSTDHFVAKSRTAGQVYEWSNYRLSCLGMNRNKGRFDDILDPFEMAPGTFTLALSSGEVHPRRGLTTQERTLAETTISRLKLNDPETCRMRAEHYGWYVTRDVSAGYLERHSPFVWHEANRQGLL